VNLGSPIAVAPVLDHTGGIVTYLSNHEFIRIDHLGKVTRLYLDQEPALIIPVISAGNTPEVSSEGASYLLLYANGEAENIKPVLTGTVLTGQQFSRTRLPRLPAPPTAAAGYLDQVAITLTDGRLFLIFGVSGQVRWNGNTHESAAERGSGNINPTDVAMIFDERGIYSLSRRGATSFTLNGKRRWLFRIPEASTVLALSDEGLIYACGKDSILRAYKVDSLIKNIARSAYGPEPAGNYGLRSPAPSPWAQDDHRFDEAFVKEKYDEINAAVRSGQIGENEPAYVAYLMESIGFFLDMPNVSMIRPLIRVPERVELIRLLGRMGSMETITFLVNIFHQDPEPSIKAACAEAIGMIGVDPKGEAVNAYRFLLSRENSNRDPQLLLSATDSIAALCRFSGPPLAGDGINLLTMFANFADFQSVIRTQAQRQIDALRREGVDKLID
jgi:outer membrane protein assembly factor BamB